MKGVDLVDRAEIAEAVSKRWSGNALLRNAVVIRIVVAIGLVVLSLEFCSGRSGVWRCVTHAKQG